MKDVVVIGLGPAGITSAIYLLRAKMDILCLEKVSFGGQINLTDRIENYPGFPEGIRGIELAGVFKKQLDKFSPEIEFQEVVKIEKEGNFIVKTEDSQYPCRGVIIATGASPRRLNIKGEKTFTGKGVSYCATCDAPFFKNKTVAVVGGGNSAIEEAIYLSKFVKKIYLVHRRDRLRADKILQERVQSLDNVEFCLNNVPEEIGGKDKVEYIIVKNVKTDKKEQIHLDGVFIFVGYKPNTEFLQEFLNLTPDGYVITDDNFQASEEGIFAAGDVRFNSLKQVVSACGEGAKAAVSCTKYVERLKGTAYD